MTHVSYKVLKTSIIKTCSQSKKESMEFVVDHDKLVSEVSEQSLYPLTVGLTATRVQPTNIAFLSEYFEKTHLSWFTEGKFFTVLVFIDKTAIDDTAQELIDKLATPQVDDPSDDKVNDIATLVAKYPCYFATVVSYQSNDPNRVGKASYEIVCRANKVVIKSSDYQYNPKDFS